MLGERLSDAHLALAIAHADCIPSIRLQYSKATADVKLYSCLPHWLDRWVAEEPISQSRERPLMKIHLKDQALTSY